ncbi:MAG TPA: LysR substrate-binding domain-containing protein [Rhizomicrobium sp.]|nr:LysR substrate-binding domain-containing protein [Rhizomicrobium sp.]
MTLEQLRIFVAVAEREHVTQAARDLNLTQSAVSAAIAALEARHAVRLFDRIGRRIVLTEAGRHFLVEARAVLSRVSNAENVLSDIAGLKRGSLSLAASQTVANYWLPVQMHRFGQTYPGITLHLQIANTEVVARMVRENAADIGCVEDAIEDPLLHVTPLIEDELVIVVSPALLDGKKRTFTPADINNLRWVFRERGSGTRAILERALAEQGLDAKHLDIALELPSNEAVRTAAIAGAGATALSRLAIEPALRSGALVALDIPLPRRNFFALHLRERPLTGAETAFYGLLSDQPSTGKPRSRIKASTRTSRPRKR